MNIRFFRNLVILNGAVPGLLLAYDAFQGQLGSNAVNNAIHITGIVSLVFLFLSLLVTPIKVLTGWNSLVAYRRALGVYGFVYALLHFVIYVVFDRMGNLGSTISEIASRRFLLVGFIALTLLIPLAATSTNAMIRWIGAKRWKLLHRLAYVATILGVVHYYMLVKSDVRQPLAFAGVLMPILGFRSVRYYIGLRRAAMSKHAGLATKVQAIGHADDSARFFKGELLVVDIRTETYDVKTIRFVSPESGIIPFQHKPGQYMTLTLDIDGQSVRRSYTIASSPTQRGHVELTIKRLPQGLVSAWLHDNLRPGQRIKVSAPAGRFHFGAVDSAYDQVLLISGGVGITPLMSMLRFLADTHWPGTVFFINCIRTPSDLIYQNELLAITERYANVRVVNFISQLKVGDTLPDSGRNWMNVRGHINSELLRSVIPNLPEIPVYLCGPDAMMKATRELLRETGVPDAGIATEEFVSQTTAGRSKGTNSNESDGGETNISEVAELVFAKSGVATAVHASETVLEAAENANVEMGWECRSGVCGQCKVRCTMGSVHMDTTEALSDAERKDGWILACQAHAADNSITLEA